jgi:hypothetical protein
VAEEVQEQQAALVAQEALAILRHHLRLLIPMRLKAIPEERVIQTPVVVVVVLVQLVEMLVQMLLVMVATEQLQQFLDQVLHMLVVGLAVKMLAQVVQVVQVVAHLHRQRAIRRGILVLQTQVAALQVVMLMLLIRMVEQAAPALLSSSTP